METTNKKRGKKNAAQTETAETTNTATAVLDVPAPEPEAPRTTGRLRHSPPQSNILERACLMNVEFGFIGMTRKVATADVAPDAEADLVKVSKVLFDTDEIDAIYKHDGEIRRYLYWVCLPSLFKQGTYLVPLEMVDEVDAQMEKYAAKRKQLVEDFVLAYEDSVEDSKKRLKDLFNPKDYPAVDEVRDAFRFEWHYLTMSVPQVLERVSSKVFERERKNEAKRIQKLGDEVQASLRGMMKMLVDHIVDRLTPDESGKKKTFRGSMLENINEFLDMFDARNIVDDQSLKSVAEKARKMLKGVDVEGLRYDDAVRGSVSKGFAEIKQSIDKLVVNAPSRKITLKD